MSPIITDACSQLENRRCIYCLETKRFVLGKDRYGISEFNAEHVVHKSFGAGLKLHGSVCKQCNKFFGETIDRVLLNDSFEGYGRVKNGLRDASTFRPRRMSVRYRSSDDGQEHTLAIEAAPVTSESLVEPKGAITLQVRGTESWETLDEDALTSMSADDLSNKYDFSSASVIANEVRHSRMIDLLKSKGVITNAHVISASRVTASQLMNVDQITQRGYCKVAFNYLAYRCQLAGCPQILYRQCFDDVRNFVRYAVEPGNYRSAHPWNRPKLDPPESVFAKDGHLLAIQYAYSELAVFPEFALIGNLQIFGGEPVFVVLSPKTDILLPRVEGGHYVQVVNTKLTVLSQATFDRLRSN